MPRPRLITKMKPLEVSLPEDLRARLDLYLFSPASGKIPQGAYQRFFIERIREFFESLNPKPLASSGGDPELTSNSGNPFFSKGADK